MEKREYALNVCRSSPYAWPSPKTVQKNINMKYIFSKKCSSQNMIQFLKNVLEKIQKVHLFKENVIVFKLFL